MPEFPPEVERWRDTVAEYVPASLVNAALWVIQYESGGDPNAIGDNGVAVGLFQIQDANVFPGRPDREYLLDPRQNIAYAAQSLGLARGKFSDWGEGTRDLYDYPYDSSTGRGYFGALGSHPFPEDIQREVSLYRAGQGDYYKPPTGATGLPFPGSSDIDWFDWFRRGLNPFGPGAPLPEDLPGVGGAIGTLQDAIGGLVNVLKWLLDPQHWIRLGFTLTGATLIVLGLIRITGAGRAAGAIPHPAAQAVAAASE